MRHDMCSHLFFGGLPAGKIMFLSTLFLSADG
jgi:hypothetical protein